MSNQSEKKPILNLSSTTAQKQTFRKLLIAMIATMGGQVFLEVSGGLPETFQMAVDLEAELVSPWKTTIEGLAGLALLILLIWGVYELWNLRSSGLLKLAVVLFAPLFLVQPIPYVSTPFADYLDSTSSVLSGMILFMGWSFPSILTGSTSLRNPEVQSSASQP